MNFAFEGTLDVTVEGKTARLTADARELTLDVDDPRPFMDALGGVRRGNLTNLREAAQTLYDLGLTLKMVKDGQTLVIIGRGAQSGLAGIVVPHLQIGVGEALRLLTG